jgi:AraC-like DNA-binding protein
MDNQVYTGPKRVWTESVRALAQETPGEPPGSRPEFWERHHTLPILPGVFLLQVEVFSRTDAEFQVHGVEQPGLFVRSLLSGRGESRMLSTRLPMALSRDAYAVYGAPEPGIVVRNAPGEIIREVVVILSEEGIRELLGQHPFVEPLVQILTGTGRHGFGANPRMAAVMRRLVEDIAASPYVGEMQRLYLHGKILEVMAAVMADLTGQAAPAERGSRQRGQVQEAREILGADLRAVPSLAALASQVRSTPRGLNEGFRELFGQTVSEYVLEARLNHARELLETTPLALKEIADRVGYAHVSNFTNAFSRRFGISPARYRRGGAGAA